MPQPTAQPANLLITGATLWTTEGWKPNACLAIERGVVSQVMERLPSSLLFAQGDTPTLALDERYLLTPGLIDLQLNGAFGVDCATASIPDLQRLLGELPKHGVTGVLATLVSASGMDMVAACNTIEETLRITPGKHTRLLGIHLEGPFLNADKRGAHSKTAIDQADVDDLSLLLSPNVKLMTLAPEHPQASMVLDALAQRGIVAMAGHTQANLLQLQQAINQGLKGVTHLFNAMQGFNHRQPGTALYALTLPELCVTLIADGHHVHPNVVRLALQLKGIESTVLVSDAMPLAGLGEGASGQFAGQFASVSNGAAVQANGTLAGSVQLLDNCVRNVAQWGCVPFEQAITMASTNPAKWLGLGQRYGQLAQGFAADMVLWDKATLSVKATWVAGQLRYCADDCHVGEPLAPNALPDLVGC